MTDKERDLIQKLAVDSALAGVAEGKRLERERIIKLLEERSECGYEHDYNGYCFCEEIALIKGETK